MHIVALKLDCAALHVILTRCVDKIVYRNFYCKVHRNPCAEADAEDALVDALCLAKCEELICVDSNLSIFAALKNPRLRLHALSSILPEAVETIHFSKVCF